MDHQSRAQGYFPGSFFRRSNRLVVNENGYHYRVRDGKMIGPFESEFDAITNLQNYIQSLEIS